MMRLSKRQLAITWVAGMVIGLPSAVDPAMGQSGPSQMRIELENGSVVVMRVILGPREKTGMHDVGPRLIIWLTDAHLRDTMDDGSVRDYERRPGAVEWIPAQRHAGENLSDKSIEFLAVVPASGDHAHR
jgi:hypothetical protein